MVLIRTHPLEAIEEDFLQGFDIRVLSARAGIGAGDTVAGLFTLVTIHEAHGCILLD
jgi:hypothetical protein